MVHQRSRHFIVLEQEYGCHDVMWKRSIVHKCVESISCSSVSSPSRSNRLYLPFLLSRRLTAVSASFALWNDSRTSLLVLSCHASFIFFFKSSSTTTCSLSRNSLVSIFFSSSSNSSRFGSISSAKQHLRMQTRPSENRVAAIKMPKPRIWDCMCSLRTFRSFGFWGVKRNRKGWLAIK